MCVLVLKSPHHVSESVSTHQTICPLSVATITNVPVTNAAEPGL